MYLGTVVQRAFVPLWTWTCWRCEAERYIAGWCAFGSRVEMVSQQQAGGARPITGTEWVTVSTSGSRGIMVIFVSKRRAAAASGDVITGSAIAAI